MINYYTFVPGNGNPLEDGSWWTLAQGAVGEKKDRIECVEIKDFPTLHGTRTFYRWQPLPHSKDFFTNIHSS